MTAGPFVIDGLKYVHCYDLSNPRSAGRVHALIHENATDVWVHIVGGLAHVYRRVTP